MPRKCSICSHGEREGIELALVNQVPYRSIAGQFSVSSSAVERHKREHLPRSLTHAAEAESAATAGRLLADLLKLQQRTSAVFDVAEREGDLRTALFAIREERGCIELLARLAGELRQAQSVDITISPVWIEVRSKVLESLAPFPEARTAVACALVGDSDDG